MRKSCNNFLPASRGTLSLRHQPEALHLSTRDGDSQSPPGTLSLALPGAGRPQHSVFHGTGPHRSFPAFSAGWPLSPFETHLPSEACPALSGTCLTAPASPLGRLLAQHLPLCANGLFAFSPTFEPLKGRDHILLICVPRPGSIKAER